MDADLHRHQCEVRCWIARRLANGSDWLRDVLTDIEKRRGKPAAERLRDDIRTQWQRGNRGEPGDWREPNLDGNGPRDPTAGGGARRT